MNLSDIVKDCDRFGPCKDGNFIEFFTKEVELEKESQQAGRPIFRSQHWVRVISPGDTKTIFETPMYGQYLDRYGVEFETWKKRIDTGDTGVIGTSLLAWPRIDRARAAELRAKGILSVEMLAAISDSNLHNFGPGIQRLRAEAQAFLEAAKGGAGISKLAAELEGANNQIVAMQQQMADMIAAQTALLQQLQARGVDLGDIKLDNPAPRLAAASTAPAIDISAQIADAVAKAVAAALPKPARGWPKGKKRGRPFQKKGTAEEQPTA